MKFTRKLSTQGKQPADLIHWRTLRLKLAPSDAEETVVEVPADWTDTAAQIIVTKYFRKAGVPQTLNRFSPREEGIPTWLWQRKAAAYSPTGPETSAKQVFDRLAGAWTHQGWKMGLFSDEQSAKIFYDELYLILARQLAAPNSPQWFNTGLWWAYGIEGPASGQWFFDYDYWKNNQWASDRDGTFSTAIAACIKESPNAYEHPQPHACFIQPVSDDLVNPGGIMDLWTREVRLFKQGSGTGTNFSTIRAKGERLSGGGVSSGLMSFLEIGDRAAGSIASGGVTRRAAKMVIVDADHPEIEDFVDWKMREEAKAAAMHVGSKLYQTMDDKIGPLFPPAILDRFRHGIDMEVFGIEYEGEAIRTVGGQNSNNSVRVTDNFMSRVEDNEEWGLMNRAPTSEKLPPDDTNFSMRRYTKVLPARDLWNRICRAAWASADPGLQFHDTINRWHTCKADGEIRASNPCSEYMFLDDTACNLASLNLVRFYKLKKLEDLQSYEFDVDLFSHVSKLMTIVLDISVSMASFPSKEIALGSYNYRTLGLGYANLGGLLMRMGLPYDSDEGRAVAAAITALMHGVAYTISTALSAELGSFPRWKANSDCITHVVNQHFDRVQGLGDDIVAKAAKVIWKNMDPSLGFRNAQVTLLAPTGTIGILMDCDTLGIEPDFALAKKKRLAGGGTMKLVNDGVKQALGQLGYQGHQINLITAYVKEHETVEGCADLKPEHLAVFDCAVPPKGFSRSIAPMGHVRMVAAVQPFLSGAVSKTVNMSNEATVEDVSEVYMQAWKLGLKAVALYRDGSKLAQPLQAGTQEESKEAAKWEFINDLNRRYEETKRDHEPKPKGSDQVAAETPIPTEKPWNWSDRTGDTVNDLFFGSISVEQARKEAPALFRGEREYLPWRREAVTQKIKIGPRGQSLHLTVGKYPDGRPGEIRLDWSRAGTSLSAMTDMVAVCVSIGLQYGVPVGEYVKLLAGRKFEPAGLIEGHDKIKQATSIADFIAKELGVEYLGREDMVEVPAILKPSAVSANAGAASKSQMEICPECSEPALTRSGTCQTCTNCGFNDGCGG